MDSGERGPVELIAKLLWEATGAQDKHPWADLPERPKALLMVVARQVVVAVNKAIDLVDPRNPDAVPPDIATNPEAWN